MSDAQSAVLMVPEILTRVIEFAIAKREDDCNHIKSFHISVAITESSSILERFFRDTPQSFMAVCRSWHETIISTPVLWATFAAFLDFPRHSYAVRVSSMLEMYFKRSKNVPFALFFFAKMEDQVGVVHDLDPLSTVFNMLDQSFTRQQHRMETVYLAISILRKPGNTTMFTTINHPTLSRLGTNFRASMKDMPMLKSMDIDLRMFPSYTKLQVEFAPHSRLEHLHLDGDVEISVPGLDTVTIDHSSNLQNLSFRMLNTKSIYDGWRILQISPNIESLHIDCQHSHSLSPTVEDISALAFLAFPHLQNLRIHPGPAMSSLDVLDHTSLPSLTILTLSAFSFNDRSLKQLASLLARSPLETFDIAIWSVEDSFREEGFGAVLRALPRLRSLKVQLDLLSDSNQVLLLRVLRNALQPEGSGSHEALVLPDLGSLLVDINLHDVTIAIGTLGNIVSICRRKYHSGLCFRVVLKLWRFDGGSEAERLLLDDVHIRRCISHVFKVLVNSTYVEMDSGVH